MEQKTLLFIHKTFETGGIKTMLSSALFHKNITSKKLLQTIFLLNCQHLALKSFTEPLFLLSNT